MVICVFWRYLKQFCKTYIAFQRISSFILDYRSQHTHKYSWDILYIYTHRHAHQSSTDCLLLDLRHQGSKSSWFFLSLFFQSSLFPLTRNLWYKSRYMERKNIYLCGSIISCEIYCISVNYIYRPIRMRLYYILS